MARYYEAWAVLSASRVAGPDGVARIPVSEIAAYCDLVKIHDLEERVDMLRWILTIENAARED